MRYDLLGKPCLKFLLPMETLGFCKGIISGDCQKKL